MDNTAEQLKKDLQTESLIFIIFYADWSPHYEWLEPAIREYGKQISDVVKVNIEVDKSLADAYDVDTVPTFILEYHDQQLWRYTGDLSAEMLKEVLEQY